jgi:hypothetical protein
MDPQTALYTYSTTGDPTMDALYMYGTTGDPTTDAYYYSMMG